MKPVSRPVIRNIRSDDRSNRPSKGKAPQSKQPNSKAGGNKAPVKAKVDSGRKPKEEKAVSDIIK